MDSFKTPLSENLLWKNNFFELYPFDGGGYFITRDLMCTLDDENIYRKILHENALEKFGPLERLDFKRFEHWNTIELSCWINRLYFLVPLSKIAVIRNDFSVMKQVKDIILYYQKQYAPPQGREAVCKYGRQVLECRDRDYNNGAASQDSPIDYQWFDFQPASRIINIVNALSFLRNSPVITSPDWDKLDYFIYSNAETIYLDETYRCPLACGNHQALRGLALLYGATYFNSESFAADWLAKGMEIINFHIEHDFHEDGLLKEISPSYHVFETWIIRDAFLLAQRYGFELKPTTKAVLEKAFLACHALTQPDGRMIVINDGYTLNSSAFLDTFPVSACLPSRVLLSKAQIAVNRSDSWFTTLDSSPFTGKYSHYHAGKNAVTIWFEQHPFVIESNCCSYDLPDFSEWHKQAQAHSTLLVNEQGDGILNGRYSWSSWADTRMTQIEKSCVAGSLFSPAPGWEGVRWTRYLQNTRDVLIRDHVETDRKKNMKFLFILHPDVLVEIKSDRIILKNHVGIQLKWQSSSPVTWELLPGKVFLNGTSQPSQRLAATVEAKNFQWEINFSHIS